MDIASFVEPATEGLVNDFIATMPESYRATYSPEVVQQHALLAIGRRSRPAHVGLFSGANGQPALCVVAPDMPGLLAAISASLMLEGFDVAQAEAYTRTTQQGEREAVDLFWVRRRGASERGPLSDVDVAATQATLNDVLEGGGMARPRSRRATVAQPSGKETTVRFQQRRHVPWWTLELETNDRSGLLLAVTSALYGEGVHIIGSRIQTRGPRVYDRFDIVEGDGSPIQGSRLRRLQLAVLAAVDGS